MLWFFYSIHVLLAIFVGVDFLFYSSCSFIFNPLNRTLLPKAFSSCIYIPLNLCSLNYSVLFVGQECLNTIQLRPNNILSPKRLASVLWEPFNFALLGFHMESTAILSLNLITRKKVESIKWQVPVLFWESRLLGCCLALAWIWHCQQDHWLVV